LSNAKLKELERSGIRCGKPQPFIWNLEQIEGIITAQARNPGAGVIVMPDAFFFSVPNRNPIGARAARYGMPIIYFEHIFVEEGGLISYSADFAEEVRQAAACIDRILKGTKPTDLPIQLPLNY
jgi:putative tryptophan/tyrosine transport system substrate-binding protein